MRPSTCHRRGCRARLYPLVSEVAEERIHVSGTFRVLKGARQSCGRWLAKPVTSAELVKAHLANAQFDANGDDPEFGKRFLAYGLADTGDRPPSGG